MTYMDALRNLGQSAERELNRLLDQYVSGAITSALLVELGTVAVSLGQQQGRLMAEIAMLSWLEAHGHAAVPVAAARIEHYADSGRVRRGIETIMAAGVLDPDVTGQRLSRLAHAETVESSQQSFGQIMKESPHVSGWVRGLEPKACELCRWWDRDGTIWPTDHTMPTHKGCVCTPIPQAAQQVAKVGREGRELSDIRAVRGTYQERQESGYSSSKKDSRGK